MTNNTNTILTNQYIYSDITNKRIGINVTTPNTTLDVNGDVNISDTYNINNSVVLYGSTLGNGITMSSLQNVGFLSSLHVVGGSTFNDIYYVNLFTGLQGYQGSQGSQGLIGYQGAIGFQGYQGIQGFQGNQGFQGYQGVIGYQGSQGYRGFQGLQGVQGYQGLQGSIGYQGIIGIQNSQGYMGLNNGIQGSQGIGITKSSDIWFNTQNTVLTNQLNLTLSGTNWIDITNMTTSITPSNINNRVLVTINIHYGLSADDFGIFRIVRNGTPIGIADSASTRLIGTIGSYLGSTFQSSTSNQTNISCTYIDTPNTTSLCSYGVQGSSNNINTTNLFIGRSSTDTSSTSYFHTVPSIVTCEIASS